MNTTTLTDSDDARTECACQTVCQYRACPVDTLIAALATATGRDPAVTRLANLGQVSK